MIYHSLLKLSIASCHPKRPRRAHSCHVPCIKRHRKVPTNKKPSRCQLSFRHEDGAPSARSTPSECCSQIEYVHLPTACRRKSDAVDLEECLPCLGSWS